MPVALRRSSKQYIHAQTIMVLTNLPTTQIVLPSHKAQWSNFACTQEDLTELIPSHLSSPLALPNLPGVEENIEVRACTLMLPHRHPAAA